MIELWRGGAEASCSFGEPRSCGPGPRMRPSRRRRERTSSSPDDERAVAAFRSPSQISCSLEPRLLRKEDIRIHDASHPGEERRRHRLGVRRHILGASHPSGFRRVRLRVRARARGSPPAAGRRRPEFGAVGTLTCSATLRLAGPGCSVRANSPLQGLPGRVAAVPEIALCFGSDGSQRASGRGGSLMSQSIPRVAGFLLLVLTGRSAGADGGALPVSPGAAERAVEVASSCPSFSWSAVPARRATVWRSSRSGRTGAPRRISPSGSKARRSRGHRRVSAASGRAGNTPGWSPPSAGRTRRLIPGRRRCVSGCRERPRPRRCAARSNCWRDGGWPRSKCRLRRPAPRRQRAGVSAATGPRAKRG